MMKETERPEEQVRPALESSATDARTQGSTREVASPDELGRQAMIEAQQLGGHAGESTPAVDDKTLHERLPQLTQDELAHLPVLRPGTQLEQGGVYVDLNHLGRGPFKALGGQQAGSGDRYVAKRDVDHELWNRLVEQDRGAETEPRIEHPQGAGESIEAYYERGEPGVGIDR
jgi:hypothetical protein